MRSWAVTTAIFVSTATFLAGCGGGSKKSALGEVAQVTLGPATLSLQSGQVTSLSFGAVTSTGNPTNPVPTFTFNSSDPTKVTVSGGGAVCAGVWDSQFVVCNGNDNTGKPIVGSATVTVTAQGVSSAPIQVAVHPIVTSIQVTQVTASPGPNPCFSKGQTATFKAQAFSNGTDITPQVGTFSWSNTGGNAVSVDANGVATALAPGKGGVVATLGGVASPAVPFLSCLPVQIILHVNGDPAGQPTESVTMAAKDTKVLQADMIDQNNVTTASAPGVSIVSNQTEVASLSSGGTGATLTAVSPGGAGVVAVCAPNSCGGGLNTPIYSNLFSVTVTGTSPATTVYATTSFPPASASPTPTIIPIDTSKTPPAAGTAINMPCPSACAVPNSMVFAANGSRAFMGTSQGLAVLDAAANTVTLVDPFVGKVLAVSPDGSTVIESNGTTDPTGVMIQSDEASQRLVILTSAGSQQFVLPGATAAAFTSDGSKAFVAADCRNNNNGANPVCNNVNNNHNVYVFSTFASLQTFTLPVTQPAPPPTPTSNNVAVAILPSGPYAYLANIATPNPTGLLPVTTCNNTPVTSPLPSTKTPNLQSLDSFKNADVVVAVDNTGIDIETATLTPLTPAQFTLANCAPAVSYSNQFFDFGVGPFTARQLLVGTSLSSHVAVLPKGISSIFAAISGSATGGVIPLAAGGTEALSGGMTPDGNTLWVGVAGTNKVDRINLSTSADDLQIATPFKSDDARLGGTNSAAPPNIVAVKPQ